MLEKEEKTILAELGLRLKNARLERDDSQKTFSFRIGVSVPTLQKMEQGSPQVAIGTWIRALSILDRLNDVQAILAPEKSLADRYYSFQKVRGRQRASKRKS